MKKAVIILPTFNESRNIELLVTKIFYVTRKLNNWDVEVLVVDSDSPDGTAKIVRNLQRKFKKLHLLVTPREGLGRAYVSGFNYTLSKLNPSLIFEMDADLSHDAKKIPDFFRKIEEGADFVIGSRYIKGGSIPKDWGIHRKVFSVLGNLIIKFGFMKLRISDWTSGYRAIKVWVIKDAISAIEKFTGYVFQVALIDNALKNNAKFSEIPINFVDRLHGKSKINSFQYIVQTLLYVFTHSPFIRYGIVGVIGATLDFGISYLLIERAGFHRGLHWLATLISAETAIISNFLLNNFWSFSHKKLEGNKNYLYKFFHFNLISGGALLIQVLGIYILTRAFPPNYWYVYKFLILAFLVIPYSYILYNKVIWKDKK